MRLRRFFAVSSEISTDMLIIFNIEQGVKKLFQAEIETLHVFKQFFTEHQKLTTIFTPIPLKNKALNIWPMSQIKGKRSGLELVYHKRNAVIRQGGFGASINFNNAGTQFVCLMVSIIPVLSRIHRNT